MKSNRYNCIVESPYYIGHNTTSLPAVTIYKTNAGCNDFEAEKSVHPSMSEDIDEHINTAVKQVCRFDKKYLKTASASETGSPNGTISSNRSSKTEKGCAKADSDQISARMEKLSLTSGDKYESPRSWYRSQGFSSLHIRNLKQNVLPVSGVAASFYNGGWLPSSGHVATDKVAGINEFIAESRIEVEAGLPGRSLTVVLGSQDSGLNTILPTICYAYLLYTKRNAKDICVIPVINMKRSALAMHTEVLWLFNSVGLNVAQLIFADEVSLSYYYRLGNLKLVLVNHAKPEPPHETLNDVVVQVLSPDKIDDIEEKNVVKVGSCCTLVAEKFASEAPELLLGRGLSRLLLAGIIVDTSNLDSSTGQCSSRDVCMSTLLLNGAGRYGCHGFFKLLRKHVFDVTNLSSKDLLYKCTEQWTCKAGLHGRPVSIGLCSLGISMGRFLSVETAVSDQVCYFRESRKLDLLLLITSHQNRNEAFTQELLIATQNENLTDEIAEFYISQGLHLSLINAAGLPLSMKAFSVANASSRPLRVLVQHVTGDFFKRM